MNRNILIKAEVEVTHSRKYYNKKKVTTVLDEDFFFLSLFIYCAEFSYWLIVLLAYLYCFIFIIIVNHFKSYF